MKLETLRKGIVLNDKIIREESVLAKINKLSTLNNSKELTSEDIRYLIARAFEGVDYILNDLNRQLKDLND
ncbi:hypothetical protein SAMN05192545_2884 [Maribacter dokdonensis]|uniref:Uncharacterized protein n=1 Tax=Maribacter dokdonensis TaxID=320912 RepID=A0ABY0UTD1_9FLAO|nr:hypothetical protein [Maribacter dokdonensis]SDT15183.1 hypothetical protein SAMN05192545_2884 [Maribacter dokdonensis]